MRAFDWTKFLSRRWLTVLFCGAGGWYASVFGPGLSWNLTVFLLGIALVEGGTNPLDAFVHLRHLRDGNEE